MRSPERWEDECQGLSLEGNTTGHIWMKDTSDYVSVVLFFALNPAFGSGSHAQFAEFRNKQKYGVTVSAACGQANPDSFEISVGVASGSHKSSVTPSIERS